MWLSVDPLANFNPFMDDEHYIDGDHNGGVLNSFNHNSYGYCYQNPVRLIDPNGKQVDFVVDDQTSIITMTQRLVFYGSQATSDLSNKIASNVTEQFNRENLTYTLNNKTYNVKMRTTFQTVSVDTAIEMAENNTDNKVQFIRISDNKRSSFHNIGENSGFYSTNDDLENSTTPSHEGAHGLGLKHTDGSKGDSKTAPNIITPRTTKVFGKWSLKGNAKNGINPYSRTWQNSLITKVLDNANWSNDNKSGSTGKATNRIYNHNGNERSTWDKIKDFFK
jgi:hypothetical protein